MSRSRVLFVLGSMSGGGAERQVIEMLKHLDRTRFEAQLYLANRSGELLSEVPSDVKIHAFSDRPAGTWAARLNRMTRTTPIARWRDLARVLADERIDLVYDRTYLATLDAAAACWLRPTRRISCCVVDPAPELAAYARRMPLFARRFSRRAYASASVVLANSEGLRRRLVEFYSLPDSLVRTHYNVVDFERLERLSGERLQGEPHSSINDTAAPFLIVTSGRLHSQKGHAVLIDAVRELVHERKRSVKLLILGAGDSETKLRQQIDAHRLESHVTLMGFVSNPLPWYKLARLFVLPSLYEGMPNVLIEAVACGTPVLSTDCPSGPSEILDEGRVGRLVPVGDSRALAESIADCMDNESRWRSITEAARARVVSMFDLKAGMTRFENLVDEVLRR